MIGVDIVAISRIEKILTRSGKDFLRKFLSKGEIKSCIFENGHWNTQRIAGFFAAKEALSKALGCGICKELGFMDMQIKKHKSGAPKMRLKKGVKKHFGIKKIHLSISHEKGVKGSGSGYAVAVVIVS